MSLAMAIRHLSGSAQLISLLNGFGHCVSHSVTFNHDTALANQEVRRGVMRFLCLYSPGYQLSLFGTITTLARKPCRVMERLTTQMG